MTQAELDLEKELSEGTSELSKELSKKLEKIKHFADREWTPHVKLHWYTDHGLKHSRAVIKRIADIIQPIYTRKDHPDRLNEDELFVLLAACYLHDIGMQNLEIDGLDLEKLSSQQYKVIRKRHPEWSVNRIKKELNDDLGEHLDPVVNVILAHGSDHFRKLINENKLKDYGLRINTVNGRLLAALLLMGDELDLQKGRVDHNIKEIWEERSKYPAESLLHIYKHYYISESKVLPKPAGTDIEIRFRFPQGVQGNDDYADNIKNWVRYKLLSQCRATQDILESAGLRWGKVRVIEDDPWECHPFPEEARHHLKKETLERGLINREEELARIKDSLEHIPPENRVLLFCGEENSDFGAIAEWLETSCKCRPKDLEFRQLDFGIELNRGQDYIVSETASLLDPLKQGVVLISNIHQADPETRKLLWNYWLPQMLSPGYRNVAMAFLEGYSPEELDIPYPPCGFVLERFNVDQVAEHLVTKWGCTREVAQAWVNYIDPQGVTAGEMITEVGLFITKNQKSE